MNCLGIGPSNGTTQLVPAKFILSNNNNSNDKINTDFIDSIKSLQKKSNIEKEKPYSNHKPQSLPVIRPKQNKSKFADVNWSNIFLTICKKRLFNYFKELKFILNEHPLFTNTFICFIDETNTRYLIQNSSNSNISTLRIQLNRILENQLNSPSESNIKKTINFNKALDLVKNLELMGPSNNLLICLQDSQVRLLQDSFQEGTPLYWPNGKEGITWLVHFN